MKKIISTVLFCLIFISIYPQSTLTIKPSNLQAGKEVRYTYSGKLAKAGTEVTVGLYTLNNGSMKQVKIEIKENKIEWKLTIPDSIVYVLFRISNGDDIDSNNGAGYGFNVYQKEKPVPGTYILQGIFNLMGIDYGITENVNNAVGLMEKEYKLNPELKENDFTTTWYLKALVKTTNRKEEAIALARKMYAGALQKDTDAPIIMGYLYISYPDNATQRDSLLNEAVKLYPKSKLSFSIKMNELFKNSDPEKVFQLYDSLLKDFPQECKKAQENIDRVLTIAYRKKKDYVNFEYYLAKKQQDKAFQAEQLNEIAWELATTNQDLPAAKGYSERALAQMDSLSKAVKPVNYPQAEWEEYQRKTTGNYYDTYGYIYYKSGNKQAAAENQQKAVSLTSGKNTYINEQLVKYLIEDKQSKEALTKAEEFKIAQQSTVKIDSMYVVAYVAVNGSTKGLDAAKANIENQIKEAPDFTLKTLDGKSVTLSSLKGKIVILDLWATWCGPCVASFPGMQKAVDALKDRNDVCFYFINTFERLSPEARITKIEDLLESKKLNFNVLLDEQAGNDFVVSKLYGVNNIPTKIIIGKNGKIYTTITGYNANEEELVKELKSIVELLK